MAGCRGFNLLEADGSLTVPGARLRFSPRVTRVSGRTAFAARLSRTFDSKPVAFLWSTKFCAAFYSLEIEKKTNKQLCCFEPPGEVDIAAGVGGFLTLSPQPLGQTPSPLRNLLSIQSLVGVRFTLTFSMRINALHEGCTFVGLYHPQYRMCKPVLRTVLCTNLPTMYQNIAITPNFSENRPT